MRKGTKHSEETLALMSQRAKTIWDDEKSTSTPRVTPTQSLRARLDASEREIARLREELDELKAWRARITASVERHRSNLERIAEKPGAGGEMCRDILQSIGS